MKFDEMGKPIIKRKKKIKNITKNNKEAPKLTKEKNQREISQALQKAAYIQSLKNGNTRKEAAEACNAGVTTIWEWKRDDKKFSADIDAALESRIQVVEDSLYKSATEGKEKRNVIAMIFWLKNRGKNWKDKQDIEFVAPKTVKQTTFIQAGEEPEIEEDPGPEIEEEKIETEEVLE